jgi:RNA polymerase sigma-70 factor, ECF subfamily
VGVRDPVTGPGDADLVAAVRRGDARAADALVRRHFRSSYAVALALLGNPMDAEDACQDSFVRALERIDDCRHPDRFVYWLHQIVRNRAHNARDYRRVRSGPSLEDLELAGVDDATHLAERNEAGERLAIALETLSPEQRQVLLLKDMEDWDHRAIAGSLGISEGMSRQHLFNARRLMRQQLREAGPEDGSHD